MISIMNQKLFKIYPGNIGSVIKWLEFKILKQHIWTYCYNKPGQVIIFLTDRCNLDCKYCYRTYHKHDKDLYPGINIDPVILCRILVNMGHVPWIHLTSDGDPLLFPLDKMRIVCRVSREHCSRLSIVTNMINFRGYRNIFDETIDFISVSLEASNKKDYQYICGHNRFDTVIDNIQWWIKAHGNDALEVNSVVSEETLPLLVDMPRFLNSIGVYRWNLQQMYPIDGSCFSPLKDMVVNHRLLDAIEDSCGEYGIDSNISTFSVTRGRCFHPFFQYRISARCGFSPCCNIRFTDLERIDPSNPLVVWNSEKTRMFRRNLVKTVTGRHGDCGER